MFVSFKTALGKRYYLEAYKKESVHKEFLEKLCTTNGVYENLRDGAPWSRDLIDQKDLLYDIQNKEAQMVLSGDKDYVPRKFGVCWIVTDSYGKMLGRGGFQPEDSLSPALSEVYLALMPGAQGQGIGDSFIEAVTHWFAQCIAQNSPLRGLVLEGNSPSQKIAVRNGYAKKYDTSGHPLVIIVWGRAYEVFEKESASEA